MPTHVYSIGRERRYRYGLDIDDCIEQAMVMAPQVREGGRDFAVPIGALAGLDATCGSAFSRSVGAGSSSIAS